VLAAALVTYGVADFEAKACAAPQGPVLIKELIERIS
jgi:hypothetical protein